MAKSFADDGSSSGGDSNSASSNSSSQSTSINFSGGGGGGGGGFTPTAIPTATKGGSGGGTSTSSGGGGGGSQGSDTPTSTGGIFFDAGGAVPDGNGQSQQQDPMNAILQRSLGSVDQTLQALYKQFGLGGQSQAQGGVQDQAANMPTAPGGQSESGVPPMQPGPGTLPPTSNPFGKRADAGGIQDEQESA